MAKQNPNMTQPSFTPTGVNSRGAGAMQIPYTPMSNGQPDAANLNALPFSPMGGKGGNLSQPAFPSQPTSNIAQTGMSPSIPQSTFTNTGTVDNGMPMNGARNPMGSRVEIPDFQIDDVPSQSDMGMFTPMNPAYQNNQVPTPAPTAVAPPPQQEIPQGIDLTTYQNIMADFNSAPANQQIDYSGRDDMARTVQGRGMPEQAGGFLPELDYIPEAMTSQVGLNVGQGLNDISLAQDGRQRAEDFLYEQATSRLDPRFEQEEQQLMIDLRNRGLVEGDAAYDAAMANFERDRNDAYNQAKFSSVNQAGQETQRNFDMDSGRRAQIFGEQMGMSQDEISRLQQDMARNELIQRRAGADQELAMADQDLLLRADQQLFDQQLTQGEFINRLRQNQINEEMTDRNQSLNELNALLSGAQVAQPQFAGYNQAGNAGGVDFMGAADRSYQGSVDRNNIRNAAVGNFFSGAGQLAGMFSDERLKDNVRKVGERNGVNLYEWTWNTLMPEVSKRGKRGFGVIAQEIAKVMPKAVLTDASGYLKVNYEMVFKG